MSGLICTLIVGFKHKAFRGRCRYSKLNIAVLDLLVRNNYVKSYAVDGYHIHILLNKENRLRKIEQISKPGCQRYFECRHLNECRKFHLDGIVSTDEGILTISQAILRNKGGELILVYK